MQKCTVGILFLASCLSVLATTPAPTNNFSPLTRSQKIVSITLLSEAGGEGWDGMYAVACVIQQRVIERKRTAGQVCLQRLQFSCWNGKTVEALEKKMDEITPNHVIASANLIARLTVNNGRALDRSKVKFANAYCTLDCNSYWAEGKKPVAIIGNHKFFRL